MSPLSSLVFLLLLITLASTRVILIGDIGDYYDQEWTLAESPLFLHKRNVASAVSTSPRLGTMSSDSDFSDDDRKKKGKNKSMDSDDSGSDHKSKRRGKGKSSQFVDSDSGSGSEDESAKPSSSRKRKAQTNKGSAKKRGRGRGSSDDDQIAGVDGLELTEEDRKMIQGMSEKDREQEIFRRMEEAERRKIRETIAKRLEQQGQKKSDSPDGERRGRGKKKERKGVVSDDSDRSLSSERDRKSPVKKSKSQKMDSDASDEELRVMPSEANRKKKQKNAMEELQIKRREKEAKKASLAVDAVFGKEDSSSDSSSSNSSRSSSPSSRSTSRSRSRSASPNKEDLAAKRPVECLEELKLARLSRFKLARFVHAPFFNKTVIDCYVRIGVGKLPGNPNKDNYRIAQVIDVVETAKVYNVESTKTNKGLKLRMGTEERVYRLEFVSNKEFSNQEFQEWMSTMRRHNRSLPTMGEIHKKMKDIASAVEHNYTNDEVNQMLKEKARFKDAPKNFAMTKGELMKKLLDFRSLLRDSFGAMREWGEKYEQDKEETNRDEEKDGGIEYAKQNQLHEEASELQAQINAVDSKADELDKKRAGGITAIDWINKRNRNTMKEQFLGDKKVIGFMDKGDDPFTRKSGKMKMVSGTAKGFVKTEVKMEVDDPTSGGLSASSSASNLSSTPIASSSSIPLKSLSSSKTPDLFSFHSISVGHDLDLNSLRSPVTEDTTTRALNASTPASGGRPLSLADYKKRKMEAKALQA
ncbi:rtfo-1 [Pristionchus pacificus]|uniref:Rtfo-1 n=1 Tax=Pristionchus pacificus TaxID=54126 RepID=A0A2A6CR47_PRIPA|nr:rtfo-1 [Pristionchus pacificus]|eukprot:PDM80609.1 rtfo-1 [Pristionchus pacificus]